MSRIGVIGTGHIAAPMVRFLAAKGHDIAVTRRNAGVSATLAAECGVWLGEPQDVLDRAEIVLLCLRPNVAETALTPLAFQAGQRIISVMAGVTRARLEALCAPAATFVQTIPLGFLESGRCPLAAHGDTGLLAELFAPENPVVPVSREAALNAHFAICAMVPGLVDMIATGADWLGEKTGNAAASEFYAGQLMSGFLAALDTASPGHLARARDALATEGTLSLQMIDALRQGAAHGALRGALDAVDARLNG